MRQPSALIRFISNIPILDTGEVSLDRLFPEGEDTEKRSYHYEPEYFVSALARITTETISSGEIETVDKPLEKETVVRQVLDSDLSLYAPDVYLLVRVVVLETFSLLHHINTATENLKYTSEKDVKRVRNNIQYIADYLGYVDKYHHMIEGFRDMHIALGYLEKQVGVILRRQGVVT